jgi:16S rRNA (guanine1516-N2)-methyltransferase
LAQHFGVPVKPIEATSRLRFMVGSRLAIEWQDSAQHFAVSAEFVEGRLGHRLRKGVGRREPLARALGLHKRAPGWVVDATAGLGRDTALIAALGCRVSALERSPFTAALLGDGLRRGLRDDLIGPLLARVELLETDAESYLQGLIDADLDDQPDAIYLDPMFSEASGSAKVRKEMQVLKQLLGPPDDEEGERLLVAARASGARRVVVKRGQKAKPLAGAKPDWSVNGKTTRYDVYAHRPIDIDRA